MIAIFTLLSAFPLGFAFRSRLAANLTYAVAYLWAFTFQSVYLILSMLDGDENPAFTPSDFPLSYGLVASGILVVGFGLVEGGHRVGRRRRVGAQDALLT
jgi:hypothetical protein